MKSRAKKRKALLDVLHSWRRRHLRRRRKARPPRPPERKTTRNWAALPYDVQWAIVIRLPHVDILRSAGLVCHAWRRLALDEAALWRLVDIAADADNERGDVPAARLAMARAAVDRSAGQCESFRGPADCHFLVYLAKRAPALRSLDVTSGFDLAPRFVPRVIEKLPMLERLVLSRGQISTSALRALVDYCPRLELLDAGDCFMPEVMGSRLRARVERTVKVLKMPRKSPSCCGSCARRAARIAEEEDD
ncbi:hypothetical protein EJB05_41327, partial [Eragrostis curvula]